MVSNLTLSSVTESDQGVYRCSIDDIGSDEVVVQVVAGKFNSKLYFSKFHENFNEFKVLLTFPQILHAKLKFSFLSRHSFV